MVRFSACTICPQYGCLNSLTADFVHPYYPDGALVTVNTQILTVHNIFDHLFTVRVHGEYHCGGLVTTPGHAKLRGRVLRVRRVLRRRDA